MCWAFRCRCFGKNICALAVFIHSKRLISGHLLIALCRLQSLHYFVLCTTPLHFSLPKPLILRLVRDWANSTMVVDFEYLYVLLMALLLYFRSYKIIVLCLAFIIFSSSLSLHGLSLAICFSKSSLTIMWLLENSMAVFVGLLVVSLFVPCSEPYLYIFQSIKSMARWMKQA